MSKEKEFDRSRCFMFFESYLESAEKYETLFGTEVAFKYLCGLARYALYQEESKDPVTNGLVSALKNTIDAGQEKRSRGFNKEDFEQTKVIAEYYRDHPNASQRTIAEATNVGKTKVQKTLVKIKESGMNIDTYIRDVINPNLNSNFNNNTNYNSETTTETSHKSSLTGLADAQTAATLPTIDEEPIAIFRNKTYKLGRFTKVSTDDKTKNEHMYTATFKMEDNSSLAEVLDCARINGVDKDYACSYIASNF